MDAVEIERALGRQGTLIGDVLKVSVPREEVRVILDGFDIIPFMGLTSWVAFRRGSHGTTMMGDIVVLEDEISAALSAAVNADLYVTALHNHFIREQPRVMFMHVEATSDAIRLADGVRSILDAITGVRRRAPLPEAMPAVQSILPRERLQEIIAAEGEYRGGVLKFTLGRPDVPVTCARCSNLDINAAMGYNTWAAFQGTAERAAVCGDFAMLETEVLPVIRALRARGCEVVAVHNHMFFEDPRVIFLHYWSIGDAVHLAGTVRRALDAQGQSASGGFCCEVS